MTTPIAFIFDLDGVIANTPEYHYHAWKRLADEEGIPFTPEDNDRMRGTDRRQSLQLLLKGRELPAEQMEAWMKRKSDYFQVYLSNITSRDLMPGVSDFLHEAKARGIKLGLASASRTAREVITNLGILDLLDAIGDAYSVSNPKPAPDLFVWVAGRLNAPPAQTVVFEDAETGVDAALKVGMFVVGLGPASRVGKAHVVLSSLRDVHVDDVLRALPLSAQSAR
jgi:beta-phosphoglucomutase